MPSRLTREESRQRTRELLLDAAEKVFSQRGFYAASVDEVAEAAGFSKGAVYSNFEGKDELFLALYDRRLERGEGNWLQAFEEQKSPQERIEAVENILSDVSEEARAWTMLTLEFFLYAMRNEKARVRLAERYRRIRYGIAQTIAQHFAQTGFAPPLPVEELSWVLLGLATGLEIQGLVEPNALPPGVRAKALYPFLGDKTSDAVE